MEPLVVSFDCIIADIYPLVCSCCFEEQTDSAACHWTCVGARPKLRGLLNYIREFGKYWICRCDRCLESYQLDPLNHLD